jgi:hypothetical protein
MLRPTPQWAGLMSNTSAHVINPIRGCGQTPLAAHNHHLLAATFQNNQNMSHNKDLATLLPPLASASLRD